MEGCGRMYPIVPPPADVAADVNFDLSHHELLELEVAPDVLILPSRLKYFAKVSLASNVACHLY